MPDWSFAEEAPNDQVHGTPLPLPTSTHLMLNLLGSLQPYGHILTCSGVSDALLC